MSSSSLPLPETAITASRYAAAMAARDGAAMAALRSHDCIIDLVYRDAYGHDAKGLSPEEFYGSLFDSFREFDFETTRTLAAEDAVFTEWTLRAIASGTIKPPLFTGLGQTVPAGQTIRLRGATLFELAGNLIRREVIYFDYLTLVVELGLKP